MFNKFWIGLFCVVFVAELVVHCLFLVVEFLLFLFLLLATWFMKSCVLTATFSILLQIDQYLNVYIIKINIY